MLGLMPGAGGTQRVLQLSNLQTALDICMTGKTLVPAKAKKLGLVNVVVDPLGGVDF